MIRWNIFVVNSNIKSRPDYVCENLKLIVEYDGDQHYRSAKKIKNEIKKNELFQKLGYTVIRIPYFIQISSATIEYLFGKKITYNQIFPHGFISKTVIMPCDFCELGIRKFESDLEMFSYIRNDIIISLQNKLAELDDKDLVIPSSLNYLLE